MTAYFINLFLDFILSPVGLAGALIGIMLIRSAIRSRPMAWLLLSLCMFAASLSKFQDQFIQTPPALVFPLQQLRDMGRPLAILLVFAIIFVGLRQHNTKFTPLPGAINWLVVVQAVIFLKTVLYGSTTFALLAAVVFGAVVLMVAFGPLRWLQEPGNFRLGVWSVAMVALIFLLVNGYQMLFTFYPLAFVHNRFLGTTGNPQHAGVLLASTIPCLIFLSQEAEQRWQRGGWMVVLVCVMGLLLWTGSRTGLLMGVLTILFFYRRKFGQFLRFGLIIGLISIVFVTLFVDQNSIAWESVSSQVTERFLVDPTETLSSANSRQLVWNAQWRMFQQNPVLGVPLVGERLMGYGESSWLGTAAALGLAGLIPLLLFGMACFWMIVRLVQLGRKEPHTFFAASVVITGLISLLSGSFFEAYLLGNITFPVLALFTYLALGQALITQPQVCLAANSEQDKDWGQGQPSLPVNSAYRRVSQRALQTHLR